MFDFNYESPVSSPKKKNFVDIPLETRISPSLKRPHDNEGQEGSFKKAFELGQKEASSPSKTHFESDLTTIKTLDQEMEQLTLLHDIKFTIKTASPLHDFFTSSTRQPTTITCKYKTHSIVFEISCRNDYDYGDFIFGGGGITSVETDWDEGRKRLEGVVLRDMRLTQVFEDCFF